MALQLEVSLASIAFNVPLLDQRTWVSATLGNFRPQGICPDFKMNEEANIKMQSVKGMIFIFRLTSAN